MDRGDLFLKMKNILKACIFVNGNLYLKIKNN